MAGYLALYRKWRPQRFEDVVGQQHITDVLRGEVERGSVSHAYLFCGSRGTGKTTCAKILAKAVSCEHPVGGDPCGECENCRRAAQSFDISEIDAASNNGVDNIRELREEVLYPPSELKRRVYIIDEVHMLSAGAFNALLKTLEEPPEHALFILATTELNKIPATILSRCKRFDFHRITPDNIASRLSIICREENIPMQEEAIRLIARLAGGAMRDALSMLELFVGKKEPVTLDMCAETLGVIGRGPVMKLLSAISRNDSAAALSVIADAYNGSKDMGVLLSECADSVRDMLMIKYTKSPERFIEGAADVLQTLTDCASRFTKERLLYSMDLLDEAQSRMAKTTLSRRAILETCVLRLCDVRLWALPESLCARVAALEEKLESGVLPPAPAQKEAAPTPVETPSPAEAPSPAVDGNVPPVFTEPEADTLVPAPSVVEEDAPSSTDETPLPDAPPAAPEPPKTAATAEPLACFPEILELIREKDPITGSLLAGAKAFTAGEDKVVLSLSVFGLQMLRNNEQKRRLVTACVRKLVGDVTVSLQSDASPQQALWDL